MNIRITILIDEKHYDSSLSISEEIIKKDGRNPTILRGVDMLSYNMKRTLEKELR